MPYLFINPPVEDFSCSNYFNAPYGMLRVAAAFRKQGIPIHFYDFLHEDFALKGEIFKEKKNGLIEYPQADLKAPQHLRPLARRFRRFGNSLESFEVFLRENNIQLHKARLLVNTEFSYRADGLIRFLKNISLRYEVPFSNMMLGGIAILLIPEYFTSRLPGVTLYSPDALREYSGLKAPVGADIQPALDVYNKMHFIPFRISAKCPCRCDYCAAAYLFEKSASQAPTPGHQSGGNRQARLMGEYLSRYSRRFNTDILAPLDDALMVNLTFLRIALAGKQLKIFTPNGLHLKKISPFSAKLLFRLGFQELRFGVESTSDSLQSLSDHKIRQVDITAKIDMLSSAGFNKKQIRFYLFYGLPGQCFEEVLKTIEELKPLGCKFNLSGYSPVPHTPLFRKINGQLGGLFNRYPGLANNSTVALWNPEFTQERIDTLKKACQMK